MSAPTAAQAMAAAAARLRAAGVPDPARDARILLAHAASVDAARVTLIAPEEIAPEIGERFEQLIALRAVRVPVSQLIGSRGFYGRDFRISRDVLDPRPETETLIELALSAPFERVLDLGTGSGCILVTLLAERRTATGVGADLSEAACLQASANAVLHEVAGRAEVIQSDWFDKVEGRFDLILSNPPYLAAIEMADVAPELRDHEPAMALTDGLDGLSVYRIIADQAQGYLTAEGRVLVEIGWQQGDAVCAIFRDAGWAGVTLAHDLDGRPRVVCADTPA
ncbi:peptide chain release factor N(5)-glutamine methyltransferase [Sulfitobacter mediterraneus]|uniref:peptide chain release factor N(5)-glutamine methyltransferase n=1 Tax=Sulfitobacter mediterraneus TaxID=83219 RepID=UPI0019392FC9|nr:peptide chain release factor N(5)-glutamine methyltransferase [Sulfitobacter mediterraneus]MBM1557135.1 peptide chain release factor N(5)-glutamine methyltransferase [Sulfitobacter mediterraneus]MBM1568181.1 peptide chain release factor N(5)-glutamine methyltransferase [Sulfitobacter mediterraneus]MBM1572216.1 peptide chain release factor N(5)-glutamine methyltransferase [Sulfitobacter mediterraneus]MBM1576005.1 peptide chain release factor N(5)-glutamine methyltransferase [Sulfitobacter med